MGEIVDRMTAWPLYFAAKPLKAARVVLKKGQLFPLQDKFYLRGLGRAYGVSDADARPIAELPYVQVLNVGSPAVARTIVERGLSFDDASREAERG